MRRLKVVGLLLTIVFVLSAILVGCGSNQSSEQGKKSEQGQEPQKQQYLMRISHVMAPSFSVSRGYVKFEEIIEAKSQGRVKIQIYDSAALGKSDREVTEPVQAGTIEMSSISTQNLEAFTKKFMPIALPYMIATPEEGFKMWEGPLRKDLEAALEEKGFKLIMVSEYGFRALTNKTREVKNPKELQGLKLRSTQSPLDIETFKAMGGNPVPSGWGEVYTLLQQGTVDGEGNTLPIMWSAKHHEVLKYVTLNNYTYSNMHLVMNLKYYNSLPQDIKDLLAESAKEAVVYDRQIAKEDNEKNISQWQQAGIKIYNPTAEEMEQWKQAVAPVWVKFKDEIGEDWIKKFYKEIHGKDLDFNNLKL